MNSKFRLKIWWLLPICGVGSLLFDYVLPLPYLLLTTVSVEVLQSASETGPVILALLLSALRKHSTLANYSSGQADTAQRAVSPVN